MAYCVTVNGDGSLVVGAESSDPTVLATCGAVLLEPADYAVLTSELNPLWSLSMTDAGSIVAAVALLWGSAYAIRVVVRHFQNL